MIYSKKKLEFYLMADMMMNRGFFKFSIRNKIKEFFATDYIMRYLSAMRKYSYYQNCVRTGGGIHKIVMSKLYGYKYRKLGIKLGFSIDCDAFSYGLVIPHYGTIVVGPGNSIGPYAVLHTSTCITALPKRIGSYLYLSAGAKIITSSNIGDNVMVSANSVVTKGFPDGNTLLVGMPAYAKKVIPSWVEYQFGKSYNRVMAIEKLKLEFDNSIC